MAKGDFGGGLARPNRGFSPWFGSRYGGYSPFNPGGYGRSRGRGIGASMSALQNKASRSRDFPNRHPALPSTHRPGVPGSMTGREKPMIGTPAFMGGGGMRHPGIPKPRTGGISRSGGHSSGSRSVSSSRVSNPTMTRAVGSRTRHSVGPSFSFKMPDYSRMIG